MEIGEGYVGDGGVGDNYAGEDRGYSPTRGVFNRWASCNCLSLAASKRLLCSKFAKSQHCQPNPTQPISSTNKKMGCPIKIYASPTELFTLRNGFKDNFYSFFLQCPFPIPWMVRNQSCFQARLDYIQSPQFT